MKIIRSDTCTAKNTEMRNYQKQNNKNKNKNKKQMRKQTVGAIEADIIMCFGTDLDLKFPQIQKLKGISISCHLKKVNIYVFISNVAIFAA